MNDTQKDGQHELMTSAFRDRESAEREYDTLLARGYKSNEIHVLMSEETRKLHFDEDGMHTDMGNQALKGTGVGGAVGGAVGATVVGLAAAAAAVTVPVLGLVIIGPLAGALAGGAAGATAGGLLGMLVGAGIPESRAKVYETDLKNGAIILGVKPRNDEDARYLENSWHGEDVRVEPTGHCGTGAPLGASVTAAAGGPRVYVGVLGWSPGPASQARPAPSGRLESTSQRARQWRSGRQRSRRGC